MQKRKKSNILFLRGVFPEQWESNDDKFKRFIMLDVVDEKTESEINIYESIPIKFNGLDQWPKTINIKCWHCTCSFTTIPIFVPGRDISIVNGIFCTFSCAEAWIESQPITQQWEMRKQLRELYYIFNKTRVSVIIPSLNKSMLKEYGGTLNHAQFSKRIRDINDLAR